MATTFLNQQNKLSRLLGDSNTETSDQWPLADRKYELNRGEMQFAQDSKVLLRYATGTVASQALDIPSDWIETYKLSVATSGGNDIMLTDDREISINDIERFQNSGADYYYFWTNASKTKQFIFLNSSTNGKTYKLWYFGKPTTDLTADGDESVFPDEYREASVYWAAGELLEQIGKTEMANRNFQKYTIFVEKAKEEYLKHYINKVPPRPDVFDEHEFDADTQGIGQRYSSGIY